MLLNFQNLKKDETDKVKQFLASYPKFKSVGMMALAGLPTPKSFVATTINSSTREMCNRILSDWKVKTVVVRSDVKGGSLESRSVQGCDIGNVWMEIVNFLKQGLLPMVISTGDIYHNTYSLNLVIKPEETHQFYIEVVGPGFCASDLNKRDIVNERGVLTKNGILINSRVVDQKIYSSQVDLMKESVIKKEIEIGKQFETKKEAKMWVNDYLASINALILKHKQYIPISQKHLQKILTLIPNIHKAGELMGYSDKAYVVSMSFVKEGLAENIYFWDIHPYDGYKNNN